MPMIFVLKTLRMMWLWDSLIEDSTYLQRDSNYEQVELDGIKIDFMIIKIGLYTKLKNLLNLSKRIFGN